MMLDAKVKLSRRQMLGAGAGAALALPAFLPASALGRDGALAPSQRITLGAVGLGGRGTGVLRSFMSNRDVQFTAICDIRKIRREAIKQMADDHYGNKDCAMYRDMHEILGRQDIDAVLIATGDRWHTMASITAAKAGKDVFCEKPCSMTIAESQALAETFRRYGRIYQAGTQRRSIGNFLFAADLIATGKLGKLHTVHANTRPPATRHDWLPAEPEPPKEEVDWDAWLGPCPWRPYNSRYVSGGWRGFFDFHGGGILEWGSHTVDLCHWAAKLDDTQPVEYVPEGTNTGPYAVHCRFANGLKLEMVDEGWNGRLNLGSCTIRFEGDNGWVETGDTGKVGTSENLKSEIRPTTEARLALAYHMQDWLDCIKSRKQPKASAAVAANSHITCHAAFIAYQLGRKLTWDPVKGEFVGDAEANRMQSRAIREPWRA
jgi:predicted dehydrogenase